MKEARHGAKGAAAGGPAGSETAGSRRDALRGMDYVQQLAALDPGKSQAAGGGKNATGMPDTVKAEMEAAFEADFSNVRVHADSAKAVEVGAVAYTQGSHIHFAPGEYRPDSAQGKQLLEHELAHVVHVVPADVGVDGNRVAVATLPLHAVLEVILDGLESLR